jgi:hypothetical protein
MLIANRLQSISYRCGGKFHSRNMLDKIRDATSQRIFWLALERRKRLAIVAIKRKVSAGNGVCLPKRENRPKMMSIHG